LIAFGVLGCATAASYMILNHFYGTTRVYAPRLENIVWENTGESLYDGYAGSGYTGQTEFSLLISPNYQSAPPGDTLGYTVTVRNTGDYVDTISLYTLDDAGWSMEVSDNSVQIEGGAHGNVWLSVGVPENAEYGENDKIIVVASWGKSPEMGVGALCYAISGEYFAANVPIPPGAGAGLQPVITYEKPVAVLPIAASIGVAMSFTVLAVWIGYRRMWGDAASTLLEQGFHDMTVRDVEIVGQIMDLKEFTIPELVRRTRASKITVWRTVQKLVEQGLVRQIEQTKPASNGLGGRGKPSRIYKYVGTRASEAQAK